MYISISRNPDTLIHTIYNISSKDASRHFPSLWKIIPRRASTRSSARSRMWVSLLFKSARPIILSELRLIPAMFNFSFFSSPPVLRSRYQRPPVRRAILARVACIYTSVICKFNQTTCGAPIPPVRSNSLSLIIAKHLQIFAPYIERKTRKLQRRTEI